MSASADHCDILVAELENEIVGTVGYAGPHRPKPDFFDPAWPIVRFMSVVPEALGHGVGPAFLIAFTILYVARIEHEEWKMLEHFGQAYADCRLRTHRVLPALRR